jgi:hypothetical protein
VNFWPFQRKGNSLRMSPLTPGGWGRPGQREFFPLFAQVQVAERNLAQACRGLEQQFLDTSARLEALVRYAAQFVEQVEKLVRLATGQEGDGLVFANAMRLIEQAAGFLAGCQEKTAEILGLLRNYNLEIEGLLRVEAELRRTMLPLKFVQTLFKAESAPLGVGGQQMFGSLTEEIEGLHGQVREIFGTKFQELAQTHRAIGAVVTQLDRQVSSLQEVTTAHRARIESSLATLKRELAANQERDVRLGRLSRGLAREVDEVVVGLQFQDIISQKLQHVRAALPELEAAFARFQHGGGAGTPHESMQALHQACRLEAGQLEVAQAELAKAEAGIRAAIEKVLLHLGDMDSQCLSLDEFKLLTTSFDGMVQVLLETIEEVRALVDQTVASAAEAHQLLEPLGGLASDLTAVVRGLSARIRLVGLNAQVQAARAAQDHRGAGLEVLSARTSEISRETSRISQQAAGRLDALAAGLAESVRAFGRLRTEGRGQQTALNQQGRGEEQQLHAFRDRALETLHGIGTSLDDIRAEARQTLESVQFSRFHQVMLPALRQPLQAIAAAAERWLQAEGRGVSHTNLIGRFKRDYTMASERQVFDGVVSATCAAPAAGSVARPAPLEPARRAQTPPPADTPAAAIPRLAAVAEPEREPVALVEAAAGGSDLGDNVELF